ncbi:MAG: glycosyltransferase family 39 protein [Cytophagales bacterium]|nr:glycosyltransferase family 39 protein [Armatimonadota bacterium]
MIGASAPGTDPGSVSKRPLSRWPIVLASALGFGILLLVFLPNLQSFFHSDDLDHLWSVSQSGPLGVWHHTRSDYFRPLFSLNMWAEWHLWGRNPFGYHLSHCLLHGLNSVLLYQFGKALGFSGTSRGIAALLFLVLPGHSEAVAWIGDRAGLLTVLFTLLTLCAFYQARQRASFPWGAALIASFVLALLSKEAALPLPVLVLLFDRLRPQEKPGGPSRWIPILFAFLPLYFLARWLYVGSVLGGPSGAPRISALTMIWGLLRALPTAICPMTTTTPAFILVASVTLLLGAWQTTRLGRAARRDVLFLLAAFYVAALPSAWTSLSPPLWGYDTRTLYPPSVFACLALGRLLEPLRFARLGAALLFLLFSAQSFIVFRQWQMAGEWVQQGLSTLATFPSCERRIVLIAPDIRYPAYVFRRGLGSGLNLFTDNPPREVLSPAPTVFYTEQDRAEIKREGAGLLVTLHYATPALKRTPAMEAATGLPIPLKSVSPPAFHLALPEPRPGDQYVYFSEGRFRLWKPEPQEMPPGAGTARSRKPAMRS